MADTDSGWLRRASELENMFEEAHKKKEFLTCYTLQLSSIKFINEDILKNALCHLFRQVPVLRVYFQERNGELWMREMEECDIDLKVIVGGNLNKEQENLTSYSYNTVKGPLWSVRFLPWPTEIPATLSQVEKEFVFNYDLLFGIHHSIADGTTNVKICNLLCNILNDLMNGKIIDDEHQLGELTSDEEILSLYEKETLRLRTNPKLFNKMKRELEEVSNTLPLIQNICKIPLDVIPMTKYLTVTIDRELSEKFYKTAKTKGITLHSALVGLINLALVKLMQKSGISQEVYNIRAFHDINIRRYYQGDSSRVLGFHGPLVLYSAPFLASQDMLSVFWETVACFQRKFHSDILDKNVLTRSAYSKMADELFLSDGKPNYYYSISNMGNLTEKLTEGGDSIMVRKLSRFSSLMNRRSILGIFVHTFRGQLNLNFAYSNRYLTQEFISRMKDLINSYMISVSEV